MFDVTMSQEPTLFDRIGGEAGIEELILAFYVKVLADPELAPFFRETSLEKLHSMQREFFAMALGGPVKYTGRSLAHVHHGRGITMGHFARFTGHLVETLRDTGASQEDTDAVIARIEVFANEVTGTSY